MKKLIVLFFFFNLTIAFAQVHVKGYYRKDGTYVQPHFRSSPDGNPFNNYSYPGNYNPYTNLYAKGNASTYLLKYYGNNSNYNHYSYENVYTNLVSTNYAYLDDKYSYQRKIDDKIIGYVIPKATNFFEIYDNENFKIGEVKLSKSRKYFEVYTLNGHKIASNRKNVLGKIAGWSLYLGGCVGIAYLLNGT